MAIYGNEIVNESLALNESLILESVGLKKEDLNDKNKVLNAANKVEKDKGKSIFDKIKLILGIISFCIFTLVAGLTSPIWLPLVGIINKLIDKVHGKKKNKEIDKVINEYKKQIKRLQEKLNKETDPEKKKQIENSIKELEKAIKEIEQKRITDEYLKKNKNGIEILEDITCNGENDINFEDAGLMSLHLFYYNIDKRKFNSLIVPEDDIMDYVNEKDNKELYDYFNKYNGDKYQFFELIDDTIFIYNPNKGLFFYGDWDPKWLKCYTFDQFKNAYKDLNKYYWDQIVEADKYFGYYKLSPVPEGSKQIELSKKKKGE